MASPSSFYTVTLTTLSGEAQVSRHFQTVKAARKWHRWLLTQSYVRDAAIYRGGVGGERI